MVPSNLKVLAKFGLCSNCSQKLDECLFARALKIFVSARMLGFSLKFPTFPNTKTDTGKHCFPYGKMENIGETCVRHECFWMILVLLTFIEIDWSEFSPRNNSLVKAGYL